MSNNKSNSSTGVASPGVKLQMELPFGTASSSEASAELAVSEMRERLRRATSTNVVSFVRAINVSMPQRVDMNESDALRRILAFARTLPGI